MMKTAWTFPGQGSQYDRFLHHLPHHEKVSATIDEASKILGEDILSLSEECHLASTRNVQLTMLTAGVAVARALLYEGVKPDYVAGHSVGAFGAAVVSNVMTFEQALLTVKLRGELMESLQDERYGMAVVIGLREEQLLAVVETIHSEEQPVYVSNRNAPKQLTLSGHKEAMEHVLDYVRQRGATTAKLLNVSTPSHSSLFLPVQRALEERLNSYTLNRPNFPFIANRHARVLRNVEAIKQDLAESIALPVRWHDATTVLYENGVRLFVEMPPGDVLKKLASSAFPDAASYSMEKNGFSDCLYVLQHKGVY
ncbi:MAG: malonate decarboxylase subunit epsilon [Solibacillus sp.]